MNKRIVRTDLAESDLIEHVDYFAESNPAVAFRFIDAVEQALERLAELPEIGALRAFANPRLAGVRLWPVPDFPKYLIFYQDTVDHLLVLRVLHGARDLPILFEDQS